MMRRIFIVFVLLSVSCMFCSAGAFATLDKVVDVGLAEDAQKAVEKEIAALEEAIEGLKKLINEGTEEMEQLSFAQQEIRNKWASLVQDAELTYEAMEAGIEEEMKSIKERYEKINTRWWQANRYLGALEEHVKVLQDVLDGSYYTSIYRLREKGAPAETTDTLLDDAREAREHVSAFISSHKED
jgi:phosphoenolpyruvate-protein kinase (PTS system EI component)